MPRIDEQSTDIWEPEVLGSVLDDVNTALNRTKNSALMKLTL